MSIDIEAKTEQAIPVLARQRVRVPLGEPGDNGEHWADVTPITLGFPYRKTADEMTRVWLLAGERELFVRFDCRLDSMASLAPGSGGPSSGPREQAVVELSPGNDPTRWLSVNVDFKNVRDIARITRVTGECSLEGVPDVWEKRESAKLPGLHVYYGVVTRTADSPAWFVEMVIPWRDLGLKARPSVMGLRLQRNFGGDRAGVDRTSIWPEPVRRPRAVASLEHGEAVFGPDAGAPECVELDPPTFGRNAATLIPGAMWPSGARTLRVRTVAGDGTIIAQRSIEVCNTAEPMRFDYWLDRRFSSHIDVFNPPRLVLEACAGDAVRYRAVLPIDRHLGVTVDEPFGVEGAFEPAPGSDPTLRDAWLDRVVRKLPRLHRAATPQGAPSDFCLMHDDGSLAANLVADDAWQRLAAIVEDRFDTVEDRLVAATALVGQKSVTNLILCPMFFDAAGNPAYHSAMHELMGPLSIMRYGGGPAVARAAVLARLLQHVHDPATGKPFVTRVVSLSHDGGPHQTMRSYFKGSISPFVQRPGRIGAVAVDYRGSQTLLDPTAMALFPIADGRLATLERIQVDAQLRTQGAGRFASAYGQIDIDEIRRQPADVLLTRGVFPELFPDEDGGDSRFDPADRQKPPIVRIGGPAVYVVARHGQPLVRQADVRVTRDDQGLRVHVAVRGIDVSELDDRDRRCERVHVLLDTNHEHYSGFHHFVAALGGERGAYIEDASGIQTLFKHLSSENHAEVADITGTDWSARFTPDADGYDAEFVLPWATLELDASRLPATVGFNVWIDSRRPHYAQSFLAPPRWRLPADPFSFADLYLCDSPISVTAIDLGAATWGMNTGRITLENASPRDVKVTLRSSSSLNMRRDTRRLADTIATVPARSSITTDFPYYVSPEEKMGGGPQHVRLALAAERIGDCFNATFRVGYCGPISTYFRYGPDVERCASPQFGEPDYLERKTRYICSKLPRFERFTTRDGAASDFVIRAHDGSVEFNLMEAGVLDRIGAYIAGLFDNDLDRILGLYFFKMSPAVMRHMSTGHRFMNGAGPISVMRGSFAGGGGNCGFNSRAFAGMAAHMQLDAVRPVAHTVGVHGHVIAAIGSPGSPGSPSKIIIDPDVGHFMLNSRGQLATIADLRSDPNLLSTAGPGDLARYLTMHDASTEKQACVDDHNFSGVFPIGGPRA